jgi:hypothetical protein
VGSAHDADLADREKVGVDHLASPDVAIDDERRHALRTLPHAVQEFDWASVDYDEAEGGKRSREGSGSEKTERVGRVVKCYARSGYGFAWTVFQTTTSAGSAGISSQVLPSSVRPVLLF